MTSPQPTESSGVLEEGLALARETREWMEIEVERARATARHDGRQIARALAFAAPAWALAVGGIVLAALGGAEFTARWLGDPTGIVELAFGGGLLGLSIILALVARRALSRLSLGASETDR